MQGWPELRDLAPRFECISLLSYGSLNVAHDLGQPCANFCEGEGSSTRVVVGVNEEPMGRQLLAVDLDGANRFLPLSLSPLSPALSPALSLCVSLCISVSLCVSLSLCLSLSLVCSPLYIAR
jgi:hypothetical protein